MKKKKIGWIFSENKLQIFNRGGLLSAPVVILSRHTLVRAFFFYLIHGGLTSGPVEHCGLSHLGNVEGVVVLAE